MAKSLALRPLPFVAAAYVLAPPAGLATLWLAMTFPFRDLDAAMSILPDVFNVGGAACLIIELVVVTPLLLGYRTRRWRWLNGWTGVALGAAIGVLASAATAVEALRNLTGVYLSGAGGQVYVVNGVWTQAGWGLWLGQLVSFAPKFALGGAVAALVLRLVAVRSMSRPPQAVGGSAP